MRLSLEQQKVISGLVLFLCGDWSRISCNLSMAYSRVWQERAKARRMNCVAQMIIEQKDKKCNERNILQAFGCNDGVGPNT